MLKKQCVVCFKNKKLTEFRKRALNKDRLLSTCTKCILDYERSKLGKIRTIYRNQKTNAKKKGNQPPDYSTLKLIEWCMNQQLYHTLHEAWVLSGYNRWLAPSCDRIDDYKGYTLENLQLMTWKENYDKGNADRKNGVNTKFSKAVLQLDRHSEKVITEYYSAKEAQRQTGVACESISRCVHGKLPVAGGFKWKFKL